MVVGGVPPSSAAGERMGSLMGGDLVGACAAPSMETLALNPSGSVACPTGGSCRAGPVPPHPPPALPIPFAPVRVPRWQVVAVHPRVPQPGRVVWVQLLAQLALNQGGACVGLRLVRRRTQLRGARATAQPGLCAVRTLLLDGVVRGNAQALHTLRRCWRRAAAVAAVERSGAVGGAHQS